MPVDGRRAYVQAQLRFPEPGRERVTSFTAFAVDQERLRREYFPARLALKLRDLEAPTGFPPLVLTMADAAGNVVFPPGAAVPSRFVDEREFALVFFDKELVEYSAPLETHRETWHIRTGYGNQTIPEIVEARARPQRALMAVLAAVLAIGVF